MDYFGIDWSDVSIDELSEETRDIAKVIGMEATGQLIEQFGGTRPYIQSPAPILARQLDEAISDRFDGSNAGELCKEFGISRRRLNKALKNGCD